MKKRDINSRKEGKSLICTERKRKVLIALIRKSNWFWQPKWDRGVGLPLQINRHSIRMDAAEIGTSSNETWQNAVQCTAITIICHTALRLPLHTAANKRQRSNYLARFANLIYLLRQSMRRRSLFRARLSLSLFLCAFFRRCHQLIHVNLWRKNVCLFYLIPNLYFICIYEKSWRQKPRAASDIHLNTH